MEFTKSKHKKYILKKHETIIFIESLSKNLLNKILSRFIFFIIKDLIKIK